MKWKYNYVYININFDCRFNTTSAYIWWENGKLYLMNFTWTRKFWIHLYQILICSNEYKFVDCRPKASCKHCHQKPNTVYQWWKIVSYLTLMKCIETRTFWFHLYQIIIHVLVNINLWTVDPRLAANTVNRHQADVSCLILLL